MQQTGAAPEREEAGPPEEAGARSAEAAPEEAVPAAAVSAEPAPGEAAAVSAEQVAQAQAAQQASLDALRRSQAEFATYKRRAAQAQAEAGAAAQAAVLEPLWPVLDDLGRALAAAPTALAQEPWVAGLHLVARRLASTLEQLGIRPLGAPGEPFDPRWHEAVQTEPRDETPEGTVVQVTRPGYARGEQVLRPAQVVVATAPAPAAGAPANE